MQVEQRKRARNVSTTKLEPRSNVETVERRVFETKRVVPALGFCEIRIRIAEPADLDQR